jgi:hypothetical protein
MTTTTTIDYLMPYLRLTLGDTNPDSYRYTDEWLRIALIASIGSLGRWWKNRYLLDTEDNVYRSSELLFDYSEPPVIQKMDERPIVLMACIIILEGALENSAWNLASWKDAEISYTNLEQGRIRDSGINRFWDEIKYYITPPSKRLAQPQKNSLPGYLNNPYETNSEH